MNRRKFLGTSIGAITIPLGAMAASQPTVRPTGRANKLPDSDLAHDMFMDAITDPEREQQADQAINAYAQVKLREDSLFVRMMPMQPSHKFVMDRELLTAGRLCFDTLDGKVHCEHVVTPRFIVDREQVGDIRERIAACVNDIVVELDSKFVRTLKMITDEKVIKRKGKLTLAELKKIDKRTLSAGLGLTGRSILQPTAPNQLLWTQTSKHKLVPKNVAYTLGAPVGTSIVAQDILVHINILGPELDYYVDIVHGSWINSTKVTRYEYEEA